MLNKELITEEMIDDMMIGNTDARVWWPHVWATLESIIINYENNNKTDRKFLIQFIEALIALMPCEECAWHFQQYVRQNPIPWNRKDILDWLIVAHDNVNEHTGKNRLWFVEWLRNISIRIHNRLLEWNNEDVWEIELE